MSFNWSSKVPATQEGMIIAYGSLVVMALIPIFLGRSTPWSLSTPINSSHVAASGVLILRRSRRTTTKRPESDPRQWPRRTPWCSPSSPPAPSSASTWSSTSLARSTSTCSSHSTSWCWASLHCPTWSPPSCWSWSHQRCLWSRSTCSSHRARGTPGNLLSTISLTPMIWWASTIYTLFTSFNFRK